MKDKNIQRGDNEEFKAKMEDMNRRSEEQAKKFQKDILERKTARDMRRAKRMRDEL